MRYRAMALASPAEVGTGRARERSVKRLVARVRACSLCADHLPLGPRPMLQLDPRALILVAGQAPGRMAHERGIPFDDRSGDRLRQWMGVDRKLFYDATKIAIVPIGLCFPGTGGGGDLPPRPECAPAWRARLMASLPEVALTLVIGRYALDWHLPHRASSSVTEAVSAWREHWPALLPLPHPSPRNQRWLRANAWFDRDVLLILRDRVRKLVGSPGLTRSG